MNKLKKTLISTAAAISLSVSSLCSIVPMSASAATLGDVNGDGSVDSKDAVQILVDYANSIVSGKSSLDLAIADTNKDSKVDSKDAVQILVYYANSIAGTVNGEDFATYSSHLLNAQGVSVYFVNIDTNKSGKEINSYDINFKIHNYSSVDKIVQIWYIDANGKEIDCACSINVRAGGTVVGDTSDSDATVYLKDLQKVGIAEISQVNYFTLSFHVADYINSDGKFTGTWENHWDSPKVTLNLK